MIGAVLRDPSLAGWDGFGLAVQAYQKRAGAVIDWIADTAQALDRRLMVRLVKGAYWDTEIKRAQERGPADYPVFTRKAMTDLCYVFCTRKLLAARPRLYPQFATHNALTVASVIEDAGGVDGYEFQRLHGMGDALYQTLLADEPALAARVYAPVGGYSDLLAYLVRRLLENGANSRSCRRRPIRRCRSRPSSSVRRAGSGSPAPPAMRAFRCRAIFMRRRAAIPMASSSAIAPVSSFARRNPDGDAAQPRAAPLIDGQALPGAEREVISPIGGEAIGRVSEGDAAIADAAMAAALAGFPAWNATPVAARAAMLEHAGDLLERNRGRLIRIAAERGRQDSRRRGLGSARSRRFLPLLCRRGAHGTVAANFAGPDRREQRIALSRPRRVRLHQPVEFSARHLYRSGRGRACGRQSRAGKTRRGDAADRR